MDISDVVYLILMVVFVVFGIFNDSKKKKKAIEGSTEPINKEESDDIGDLLGEIIKKAIGNKPPPPPITVQSFEGEKPKPNREKRFAQSSSPISGFESSMNLVTDFAKESSLKGYVYEDKFFENSSSSSSKKEDPYINEILDEGKQFDLRRAILYSEIINKRY